MKDIKARSVGTAYTLRGCGRGGREGGLGGISSLKRKNNMWGGSPEPFEIILNLFKEVWRDVMKKNAEATERRGSVTCYVLLR